MISSSNEAQRKEHERWHGQEIDAVEVFNQLNSAIVRLPEYPRAIDTLQRHLPLLKKMQCQRHLPLLKKMQCLLSQRPRRGGDEGFYEAELHSGKNHPHCTWGDEGGGNSLMVELDSRLQSSDWLFGTPYSTPV